MVTALPITLKKSGLYTPQKGKISTSSAALENANGFPNVTGKGILCSSGHSDIKEIVLRLYQARGGKCKTVT